MKQEFEINNLTGKQFLEFRAEKGADMDYAEFIEDDKVSTVFNFLTRNLHRDYVSFLDEYDYNLLILDLTNICKILPGTFEELKKHLEKD